MKIAVIGSGISGLGAAYSLSHAHDICLYEANDYLGGHSRTIDVRMDNAAPVPVDTGFIVYNNENYPLLSALFRHLNVATEKSDMSFGVSVGHGWLEYSSKALFAQPSNLLWRNGFCKMMRDVVRFNREAHAYLEASPDITLGQCLDRMKMGPWFRDYYLKPMGAAIWSCSTDTILNYPARAFLRFFKNHGLLTVNAHPQWYTVTGGSRAYIEKITAHFRGGIKLNCGAVRIIRENGRVIVQDAQGGAEIFDHVILACNAAQSLALLQNPDAAEREILGAFAFQKNRIVTHSDESFMPRRRKAWASWTYLSDSKRDEKDHVSLTYWMNLLQNLQTPRPVFVTLNPSRPPRADLIYDTHEFSHPVFTVAALAAQEKLPAIQGAGNIWHCGAWHGYGFHEDGLASAVRVVKSLSGDPPWI